LDERAKSGRPSRIDPVAIVLATPEPPPEKLGVTHWSSRLLAKHLGILGTTCSRQRPNAWSLDSTAITT